MKNLVAFQILLLVLVLLIEVDSLQSTRFILGDRKKSQVGEERLQAVIHIGQDVVGSAEVQAALINAKDDLRWRQTAVYVASEHIDSHQHHDLYNFVQHAKEQKLHIIYSSDSLWRTNDESIRRFARIFSDFNVTLVMVFRDSVVGAVAGYKHSLMRHTNETLNVAEHVQKVITSKHLNPVKNIRRFWQVFHKQQLYVIDYFGAMARGVDVGQVLLCEIAASGCMYNATINKNTMKLVDINNDNIWRAALLLMELFQYGRSQWGCHNMHTHHRRVHTGGRAETNSVLSPIKEILKGDMLTRLPKIPLKRVELSESLWKKGVEVHKQLSLVYGDKFLYSNATANFIARVAWSRIEFIDQRAFSTDVFWRNWLLQQMKYLQQRGYLTNCIGSNYRQPIIYHDDVVISNLTAYVFIGQNRAGGALLRNIVRNHSEALLNAGVVFNFRRDNVDFTVDNYREWRYDGIDQFLRNAQESNLDVLYASDVLWQMPTEGVIKLAEAFKNFNVKVIFCYRDIISRAMLAYYQQLGSLSYRMLPREFFRQTLYEPKQDAMLQLERFVAAFGPQQIHVLDHEGIHEAGKSTAEVVLCEIMGRLGLSICAPAAFAASALVPMMSNNNSVDKMCYGHELEAANDNVDKKQWDVVQMIVQILKFGQIYMNCSSVIDYPHDKMMEILEPYYQQQFSNDSTLLQLLKDGDAKGRPIPFYEYPLHRHDHAAFMFRERLQRNVLKDHIYYHQNVTAAGARAMRLQLVDEVKLFADYHWQQWLAEQVEHFAAEGYLLNCQATNGTALKENPIVPSTRLRAFIHIGQNKAGSSHLQLVVAGLRQQLLQRNITFRFRKDSWDFTRDDNIINTAKRSTLREFIRDAKKNNQNVIYSSETLWNMPDEAVQKVAEAFHGFDVTIVLVYRDSLTRAVSAYNQHVRNFAYKATPQDFFKNVVSNKKLDANKQLTRYSALFGQENIYVMDFYGVSAARKDTAEVFLCDIIGFGCEGTVDEDGMPLKGQSSQGKHRTGRDVVLEAANYDDEGNTSRNWASILMVVEILRWGKERMRCKSTIDYPHYGSYPILDNLYNQKLALVEKQPPRNSFDTSPFQGKASRTHDLLSETFNERFLYCNSTANAGKRSLATFDPIDRRTLLVDPFWTAWLEDQVFYFAQQGYLVDCLLNGKKLRPPQPVADDIDSGLKQRAHIFMVPHEFHLQYQRNMLIYLQLHADDRFAVGVCKSNFSSAFETMVTLENGIAFLTLSNFLTEALRTHKEVLYLCTMPWQMKRDELQQLAQEFIPYDVTVTVVYQDLILHSLTDWWISSQHMFGEDNAYVDSAQISVLVDKPMQRVRDLITLFGIHSVWMIDHYGAVSAGTSDTEVLLCEIIGIRCYAGDEPTLSIPLLPLQQENDYISIVNLAARMNPLARIDSPPLSNASMQLYMGAIHQALSVHGCFLNIDSFTAVSSFGPDEKLPKVQLKTIRMQEHFDKAVKAHHQLRAALRDHFLYADVIANEERRSAAAAVDVVDLHAMHTGASWQEWLRQRIEQMMRNELLTNCTFPSI